MSYYHDFTIDGAGVEAARWRHLYGLLPEPIYACHLAETPKGLWLLA